MKRTFATSRYGWQRDLPDCRDHLYSAPLAAPGPVPNLASDFWTIRIVQ